MNEERKLYEEWLHKVKETFIDEWQAWQARAALAESSLTTTAPKDDNQLDNLASAAPTVVMPVASLMTHIKSGDVKLVWNDEAFDRTLWRETPLYAKAQPTAEDIAQDWDLLQETQAALRDAWAILNKLKAVQDAARNLVESDPDSAADTEGEAFTAWCALVAAIDDADTLLCEFGDNHE